ncbi:TPA: hypothetical protein ACY4PR_001295 [Enterobacter cloacae]
MTILSTLSDASHASFIEQLIALHLPASADLFDVVDLCAAFASALVETDEVSERNALCGRLLHAGRLAGHVYAGSLCASAGTGNTGKYPAAEREQRAGGVAARYGVPAGGLCEGALPPVLKPLPGGGFA